MSDRTRRFFTRKIVWTFFAARLRWPALMAGGARSALVCVNRFPRLQESWYDRGFDSQKGSLLSSMAAKIFKNFIGGEWVESRSGQTYENLNPADTRDVIGVFQRS